MTQSLKNPGKVCLRALISITDKDTKVHFNIFAFMKHIKSAKILRKEKSSNPVSAGKRAFPIVFLIVLSLLISCKSSHYTPTSYHDRQLIIGSGGGVTGAIKEYAVFENGQLFINKGVKGDWRELKSVSGRTVRKIFSKAESLGLDELKFNHPGNMSYYLIYKNGKKSNEVKWGDANNQVPPEIAAFYQELIREL